MPEATKKGSKKPPVDYETLKAELDSVMAQLQHEDLDVDEALDYYRRGLELVRQLEQYLEKAENKIIELKAKFNVTPA